jgi:hypothetical protein
MFVIGSRNHFYELQGLIEFRVIPFSEGVGLLRCDLPIELR